MRTISYDPLWKTLIDRKMSKMELRERAELSKSTFAKLGKDESVTLDTLLRIARVLDCDIVDIVSFRS